MGDIENSNFYFIFKGEIELSIQNPTNSSQLLFKKVLKVSKNYVLTKKIFFFIKEKEFFNEFAFVTNSPQQYNMRTLTFCTFYSINRVEFLSFLRDKFQEDFVNYY